MVMTVLAANSYSMIIKKAFLQQLRNQMPTTPQCTLWSIKRWQ